MCLVSMRSSAARSLETTGKGKRFLLKTFSGKFFGFRGNIWSDGRYVGFLLPAHLLPYSNSKRRLMFDKKARPI